MTERDLGVTINVRRDVMMWHTCLCVDHTRAPVGVVITNDPLDHAHYAQVVMHKTRSKQCAIQVARYVRRTFGIEEPVATRNAPRPREAMIGYACTRTAQHAPTETTPGWGVFQHIAATPIKELLREVADGHNAARTRYVVYEVRSPLHRPLRGVTNRYPQLERRYLEAPPDVFWPQVVEVVQVGRFATAEEAMRLVDPAEMASDLLWTRKPPVEYVRGVLAITEKGDEIVWRFDGTPALREYETPSVCVGPHVYTEFQVRHVLEHGTWPPSGNSREGRVLMSQLVYSRG